MPEVSIFSHQLDILTVIGLLISIAFLGSKLFQRLGIPQVVGFIVMGVLMGTSFLNLVPLELANELTFVSEVALGLIGFDMGSHLLFDELRKLGRSILAILIFEALGTFALVTGGIYALTGSWATSLVFGAIASATAPAATVDVLAEYDAKGPLTTSLLAVVGLDDAVSLVLYSVAAAFAVSVFSGGAGPSLGDLLALPLLEIGGSAILGLVAGLLLEVVLRRLGRNHDAMAISIGFIFLCVGISRSLGLSLILSAMIMGAVVVNRNPEHSKSIRFTIEQAGPVIYVLFFSLVGARFRLELLPTMGLLGAVYILLRSSGKFLGAWLGGRVGGAQPAVRQNLGLGLLSQAGVAIGLAMESDHRFAAWGPEGEYLGSLIINVITATTFVVQIVGPICVKWAITRAGEVGGGAEDREIWASEGVTE